MHTLLDQEAPGLSSKLESLSLGARRTILASACLHASKCMNEPGPSISHLLEKLKAQGVLSVDEIAEATSLAETADAKYFELKTKDLDHAKMLESFSEARLLTAMAIGFKGTSPRDTSEAVYELSKVCSDPSSLIKAIESNIALSRK